MMKWIFFFAGRVCTFLYETLGADLYKWLILRLYYLQMILNLYHATQEIPHFTTLTGFIFYEKLFERNIS
jgi:hypothetical protein